MKRAIVTGGSQGVGKGIVLALCEQNYQVFFTGRNKQRLKEVEESAKQLGGEPIGLCVDHYEDDQVENFFSEVNNAGPLNLLVNSVWGGYENMYEEDKERFTWNDPYWKQPMWRWQSMIGAGLRAAYKASSLGTQNMLIHSGGLIVNISYWAAQKYLDNTIYGISKAAIDKMTSDMAHELKQHNIDDIHIISMYPGLVRTERVLENADFFDLSNSESPQFTGMVISALENNKIVSQKLNGQICVGADLAQKLGIKDIDGKVPLPLTLSAV